MYYNYLIFVLLTILIVTFIFHIDIKSSFSTRYQIDDPLNDFVDRFNNPLPDSCWKNQDNFDISGITYVMDNNILNGTVWFHSIPDLTTYSYFKNSSYIDYPYDEFPFLFFNLETNITQDEIFEDPDNFVRSLISLLNIDFVQSTVDTYSRNNNYIDFNISKSVDKKIDKYFKSIDLQGKGIVHIHKNYDTLSVKGLLFDPKLHNNYSNIMNINTIDFFKHIDILENQNHNYTKNQTTIDISVNTIDSTYDYRISPNSFTISKITPEMIEILYNTDRINPDYANNDLFFNPNTGLGGFYTTDYEEYIIIKNQTETPTGTSRISNVNMILFLDLISENDLGYDYMLNLGRSEFRDGKDYLSIYELPPINNHTSSFDKVIYKKIDTKNTVLFFNDQYKTIDFSIDLSDFHSPDQFNMNFVAYVDYLIEQIELAEHMCFQLSDISNTIVIPPPKYDLKTVEKQPIILEPGKRNIELFVKSLSNVDSIISFDNIYNSNDLIDITYYPNKVFLKSNDSIIIKLELIINSTISERDYIIPIKAVANPVVKSLDDIAIDRHFSNSDKTLQVYSRNLTNIDSTSFEEIYSLATYSTLNSDKLASSSQGIPLKSLVTINIDKVEWHEKLTNFTDSVFDPITGIIATLMTITTTILGWKVWKKK